MQSARLFIRDDDVWTMDKEFRSFFDLAIDHALPVVYAVIPGKMDNGLVRFLRRAKEKTPHLLDIVQHGWRHVNYSMTQGTKYEFGVARSLKDQHDDIQQGLKKMRLAFGECFTPAFVPPFHGYDQRTWRILQKDFEVFSAGNRRPEKKGRLLELPAGISCSHYEQDKKSTYTAAEMIKKLVREVYRRPLSGVVTHHEDFKTAVSRRELARFFDRIAAGRNKMGWQILLFSDVIAGLKKA